MLDIRVVVNYFGKPPKAFQLRRSFSQRFPIQ